MWNETYAIEVGSPDNIEPAYYCLYGSASKEGPWIFIGTGVDDDPMFAPTDGLDYFFIDFDLATHYVPLWQAKYGSLPVEARSLLFVASNFSTLALEADFTWVHLDAPLDLTLAPGIDFEAKVTVPRQVVGPITHSWTFGDQATSTQANPHHNYATPGPRPVCLTASAPQDARVRPDTVCKMVTVKNRAPTARFSHTPEVACTGKAVALADAGSTDPDGFVGPGEWTVDGQVRQGSSISVYFSTAGTHSLEYRVPDNSGAWASASSTIEVRDTDCGQGSKVVGTATVADFDGDGIQDHADNCVGTENRGQEDADRDGRGDACDSATCPTDGSQAGCDVAVPGETSASFALDDADGDKVSDSRDNCRQRYNPAQGDADHDAHGDACDDDLDGDGMPQLAGPGAILDNCPHTPNPGQEDADQDGDGDACDQRDPAAAAPLESPLKLPAQSAGGGFGVLAALVVAAMWARRLKR